MAYKRQKTINCPYCNYEINAHTTIKGEENPKEGDIGFCIDCGEAGKFQGDHIVKLDIESLDEDTIKEVKLIEHEWLKLKAVRNLNV